MRDAFILPQKIRQLYESLKKLDSAFWIGHSVVLLSTVLGVYLAARAGLDTALEFENIRHDRDNYYLRLSLKEETEHNILDLEKMIDRARRLNVYPQENAQGRRLRYYFIYDSLLQNATVLNTPSQLILGVQRFYNKAEHILDEGKAREITHAQAAYQLEQLIEEYKTNTLTLFEKNLATLKNRLIEANVPLVNSENHKDTFIAAP